MSRAAMLMPINAGVTGLTSSSSSVAVWRESPAGLVIPEDFCEVAFFVLPEAEGLPIGAVAAGMAMVEEVLNAPAPFAFRADPPVPGAAGLGAAGRARGTVAEGTAGAAGRVGTRGGTDAPGETGITGAPGTDRGGKAGAAPGGGIGTPGRGGMGTAPGFIGIGMGGTGATGTPGGANIPGAAGMRGATGGTGIPGAGGGIGMPGAGGGTGGVGTGGVFMAVVNLWLLKGFLPILHFFGGKASGKRIK